MADNCALTTICYFDAFSGLSGDMLVGCLADAGASPEAIIAALTSMGVGAEFSFERVKRRDVGAMKFRVAITETIKHRHLPGILKMIERAHRKACPDCEEIGKENFRCL